MHRILFLPDIWPAGYPADPKAGYRISGKGQIPDIRPDNLFDNYIFGKTGLAILDFCKHQTKHNLGTKYISVQIFCLALFEEKLNKLLDQRNNSRISGLTGYPAGYLAGQSGIRPDTGYQKRPEYPAGYPAGRISGPSLIFTTDK
jgi:hypothetical protein